MGHALVGAALASYDDIFFDRRVDTIPFSSKRNNAFIPEKR
jgi:hypothetical protein